jgi:hypothetical protein
MKVRGCNPRVPSMEMPPGKFERGQTIGGREDIEIFWMSHRPAAA